MDVFCHNWKIEEIAFFSKLWLSTQPKMDTLSLQLTAHSELVADFIFTKTIQLKFRSFLPNHQSDQSKGGASRGFGVQMGAVETTPTDFNSFKSYLTGKCKLQ